MTVRISLSESLLVLWFQSHQRATDAADTVFWSLQNLLVEPSSSELLRASTTMNMDAPLVSSFLKRQYERKVSLFLEDISAEITQKILERLREFHFQLEVLMEVLEILNNDVSRREAASWNTQQRQLSTDTAEGRKKYLQVQGFVFHHLRLAFMSSATPVIKLEKNDPLYQFIREEFRSLLLPIEQYLNTIEQS